MATSLMPTITVLASADSRMPKTSSTVSNMTIRKPTTLKFMCQPVSGEYAGFEIEEGK